MSDLAQLTLAIAVFYALCGLALLSGASGVVNALRALPRSRWAGTVLAAIAIGWSALALFNLEMGSINKIKPFLPYLALALWVLVCVYMPELLACRAIGGIALLLPAHIITTARFFPTPESPSPYRLLMITLAYLIAIKGAILIAYPYIMRRAITTISQDTRKMRTTGAMALAFALGLTVLAVTCY